MTRVVFMASFLAAACAAVEDCPGIDISACSGGARQIQQGHEQKYEQGPEEASALQTLLGQKLRNVETVVHKIASGVSSRTQKSEKTRGGDWEVCDQCDANNPNIDSPDNRFCWPGTADYCDADPCDAKNPLVNRPGWWCRPGTSKVIVSKVEYDRSGSTSLIHVNQPRSQQREFPAMLAIPPARTWQCVPCNNHNDEVKGKWCVPNPKIELRIEECSHACDPCDPSNSGVNKKGWFCRRGTADVCVDENGWTVLNYAAGKFDANGTMIEGVIPGTAIPTLTCSNNPWCIWGAVVGAVVAVVVTAGAAAYFGLGVGAAVTTGYSFVGMEAFSIVTPGIIGTSTAVAFTAVGEFAGIATMTAALTAS